MNWKTKYVIKLVIWLVRISDCVGYLIIMERKDIPNFYRVSIDMEDSGTAAILEKLLNDLKLKH